MAKLPRSPIAQGVSNNYRPVQEARASGEDPVGRALEGAGNAGFEIASRMADAKIAADAARAELDLANRLDLERRALEDDNELDPASIEPMFQERASAAVNEIAGNIRSPALKRAFALKSAETLQRHTFQVRDVSRRKQVDRARGEFVTLMDDYGKTYDEPANYLVPKGSETSPAQDRLDSQKAFIQTQMTAGVIDAETAALQMAKAEDAFKKGLERKHLKAIDDALDNGDYSGADSYFMAHSGEIDDPDVREKTRDVIEAKRRDGEAITKADEFWAKSGGDYGAALNDAYGIQNPEERLAVEARLAQLKNQFDAAVAASDQAQFEEGLSYIVQDKPVPSSVFQKASPKVIKELQDLQRSRREQSLRMASMTADQKAAMKDVSEGNYLKLTAQLTDPQLVLAGRDAVLADPGLRELYDNMLLGEQNKFDQMIIDAKGTGGVPADKTLKAYKDVVALVATSMPNYAKDFRGLGEGDPGVARISQGRTKKASVLDFEGAVMRMVGEELARTGGAEITQDRAKQIAALAFAEAGAKKDGTTKYPIPKDVASGIVATEARTQIIEFRRDNPELWSETTAMVRSKYPDASDALILAEAQRIRTYRDAERLVGFTRGFFGAGNADE